MENKVLLKRTSPKPYPTKGRYVSYETPATRANILLNNKNFYDVIVWDIRSGYPWSEHSYSQLHGWTMLNSVKEAKQWLIENYGGRWCECQ